MSIDFELVDYCTMEHWLDWQQLVTDEQWTAIDKTVFEMYPQWKHTKVVVARRKSDKSFLGSIVWVEQDGVAILDTYLVIESARGQGIGSKLWNYFNEKRNKEYVFALRSVPEMVDRYLSTDLPIRGEDQCKFICNLSQLTTVLSLMRQSHPIQSDTVFKRVCDLTPSEFQSLLSFDQFVTSRNRRDLLTQMLSYPYIYSGVVITDNKISSFGCLLPTCGTNTFRLAPLYAILTSDAITVVQGIIEGFEERNEAEIHFYFTQTTVGWREWIGKFEEAGVENHHYGTTMYSRKYENGIRRDMVHIAHDNFLHFDM